MRYFSSSEKASDSASSPSPLLHAALAPARAKAKQIKRIRVGYFSGQDNNCNLAEKCRKSIRYSTTALTVKNTATHLGAASVLVVLAALCALVPTARAQSDPAEPQEQNPFINKIIFTGNESIPEKELKRQMKTRAPSWYNILRKPRLSYKLLNRDIAHLEGYYRSAGFFEASVTLDRLDYSNDGTFADIVITIREGNPTLVASVEFSPNSLIDADELRKDLLLKPGEPYNASYLNADLYTLQSKYFDRGYLAVSISESVQLEEYRASIYFEVEAGTQITIRDIHISGNVLSKLSVIEKEIAFESGDICRLSKLVETQRNLYESGLFTVVDITPEDLDPLERTVDIHIRVRERKAAYIEGGFGVGNILGSRIFAQWGTRNLFGTGRGLRVQSEYGFDLFEGEDIDFNRMQFRNNFWRYDIEYFQRYVFGLKALMSLDAYVLKDATVQNIIVRRIGGQLLTRRRLGRFSDAMLGFTDEFIRTEAFAVRERETESRFLTGSVSNDKRDFILNPRTGVFRFLRLQFAGGFLGGDNDFYTVNGTHNWYWGVLGGDVLAVRVRAGYADHFGQSEVVPIENRFFAGGNSSVRGYRNNSLGPKLTDEETGDFVPLGGKVLLLTNLELRFDIPLLSRINISGAAFFDGGNVWASATDISGGDFQLFKPTSDVDINDYRYGVGLRIRYNTPIGPIRLDYGIPLKTQEGEPDSGLFYLSLGQTY